MKRLIPAIVFTVLMLTYSTAPILAQIGDRVFFLCIQDEVTQDTLQFNSTGAYKYTRCSDNRSKSGVANITKDECIITLTDNTRNHAVSGEIDTCSNMATASIVVGATVDFLNESINDNDIKDNLCACAEQAPTDSGPEPIDTCQNYGIMWSQNAAEKAKSCREADKLPDQECTNIQLMTEVDINRTVFGCVSQCRCRCCKNSDSRCNCRESDDDRPDI